MEATGKLGFPSTEGRATQPPELVAKVTKHSGASNEWASYVMGSRALVLVPSIWKGVAVALIGVLPRGVIRPKDSQPLPWLLLFGVLISPFSHFTFFPDVGKLFIPHF